jgi:tetratricopeptide (TPR) repeat protein
MPPGCRTSLRPARLAAALLCLAALALSAGCRKSATELAEKEREERETLQEAQWRLEQAEARARNLYYQGKDFQAQGRYKEAVETWATAIGVDKNVELIVQLAKNLMATEMLDKAHHQMHRPFENRNFWSSSRQMLDTIVDPKNGFYDKHVKKAYKELDEWEWIKGGWQKYDKALELIDTHRLAEGLDLLENISKNYPRTPLADEAIKLLIQYGRH